MPILGSRLWPAVAAVLGLVIVGLLLNRAGLKTDLADERRQVAVLQAALIEQNAAVAKLQADAAFAEQAAALRAKAAVRPRVNPMTAKELDAWLASP